VSAIPVFGKHLQIALWEGGLENTFPLILNVEVVMAKVLNDVELRKEAAASRKKAADLEHQCRYCDPLKHDGLLYLAAMYRRSAQRIEDYLFNKK